MSCLLHIETSTTVCSVALSLNGEAFFEKVSFHGPSHAALLGVYVEEALARLTHEALHPDAIAVSGGPGSYTGLRIGVSMAKGLCFGYDIPLVAVPTLEILAAKVIAQTSPSNGEPLYCAMLDARRMEVYAALFNRNRQMVRQTRAEIVTADTYASFLALNKVYFLGNGAAKCKEVIASPQAVFVDDIHPLAVDMIPVAEELFQAGKLEDTAYFEPFYLKEFMATTPKNKLFTHDKH
ncbi:MAG: tRNA (adenosine(37)-N6)-threonylcarbamoyltransferase complex dimerization subunit type 1 TsaB [Tannerellaceae bacterium]|jgi:tRNA threonylcarbamoyladenosine biosynthesis protein TsaB|nr:tRNA (adenosine(37)-N6)-threonylcarbamoyltransferase complex dimerization subunit type 1 TsaB [Tannerellaceae bacterium]